MRSFHNIRLCLLSEHAICCAVILQQPRFFRCIIPVEARIRIWRIEDSIDIYLIACYCFWKVVFIL